MSTAEQPNDDESQPLNPPSKGGKARAEKLTEEERQKIAQQGADARWEKLPIADHTGTFKLGGREIDCAVLDDGRHVIMQESFMLAIGRAAKIRGGTSISSGDKLPPFLAADNLKPFIGKELLEATNPIVFRALPTGEGSGRMGKRAYGYDADLLEMVCDVYAKAKAAGSTRKNQEHIVQSCLLLSRGMFRVGVRSLIGEATGFQKFRARRALEEFLERFISQELLKWTKTFPDEFYEELYRLKEWKFDPESAKRPGVIGKLTSNMVYERIAPGVLEELKRKTPKDNRGRRKHRYHQRLTEDVGHPRLREHLDSVITLMRASDNWEGFYKLLQRGKPKQTECPLFDLLDDDEKKKS